MRIAIISILNEVHEFSQLSRPILNHSQLFELHHDMIQSSADFFFIIITHYLIITSGYLLHNIDEYGPKMFRLWLILTIVAIDTFNHTPIESLFSTHFNWPIISNTSSICSQSSFRSLIFSWTKAETCVCKEFWILIGVYWVSDCESETGGNENWYGVF